MLINTSLHFIDLSLEGQFGLQQNAFTDTLQQDIHCINIQDVNSKLQKMQKEHSVHREH